MPSPAGVRMPYLHEEKGPLGNDEGARRALPRFDAVPF